MIHLMKNCIEGNTRFYVPGFDEYSDNLIKSSTNKADYLGFGKDYVAETQEIPYNNAV